MLELSACIEWLFAEQPHFADRIRSTALFGTGARLEAFVSEPEGQLVDSRTHGAFATGVAESARAASAVGCSKLIVLAGDKLSDAPDREQHDSVVVALRRAAPIAAEHGITLLLEPLNTRTDHIGHFLDSTRTGLEIIEDVAKPNVQLLLDLYHSAVMGEQLDEVVGDRMGLVGHIHVADAPGRHEPGTGEIDWPATVAWLQRRGYTGRLGLEYQPSVDTLSSLSFIRRVLDSPSELT